MAIHQPTTAGLGQATAGPWLGHTRPAASHGWPQAAGSRPGHDSLGQPQLGMANPGQPAASCGWLDASAKISFQDVVWYMEEIAQETSHEEDTRTRHCVYFSALGAGFPKCQRI